eukprot:1899843-Prymnesium_polylepis.1
MVSGASGIALSSVRLASVGSHRCAADFAEGVRSLLPSRLLLRRVPRLGGGLRIPKGAALSRCNLAHI